MSIKQYAGDYESYEQMLRHAEHHGGGVDLDYDGVKEIVALLENLKQENERLKKLLNMANYAVWQDRM